MGEVIFASSDLSYRYEGADSDAVSGVTLTISRGELVSVVGPNGSGKTTLLKILLGVIAPSVGGVLIKGKESSAWTRREMARLVGVVPQREEPVFPLRVRQAVMLGRYPHLGPLQAPRQTDVNAVELAMERCDVTHLGERWVATLSSGEWQRTRVARALAQDPEALVLDEPTANLDIRHEMEVFELAAQLTRDAGMAGILVTHQVNLAARFSDRVVVMDAGKAIAIGEPSEVLSVETLERVFNWPVALFSWKGVQQFVPKREAEF